MASKLKYLSLNIYHFSIQVTGVGYTGDGEIIIGEMFLNQGHLMEKNVVVDDDNHPGIRKIVEVMNIAIAM